MEYLSQCFVWPSYPTGADDISSVLHTRQDQTQYQGELSWEIIAIQQEKIHKYLLTQLVYQRFF